MPVPFDPVTIPLVEGAREDLADLAADNPSALQAAENVVFTRKGAIRPRPGQRDLSSESVLTYTSPLLGPTVLTLTNAVNGFVPAGVVPHRAGSTESPLALYQGRALHRAATGTWSEVGSPWSTRVRRSSGLTPRQDTGLGTAQRVSCGSDVVVTPTSLGLVSGIPVLDDNGAVITVETDEAANFLDSSDPTYQTVGGVACRRNAYWVDAAATTLWSLPRGVNPGAANAVSLDADARDILAACEGQNGVDYLVFVRDSDPTTIAILTISASAGTVLDETDVGAAAEVTSVDVAYDGTRLLIACTTTANGTIQSWVFSPYVAPSTSPALEAGTNLTYVIQDDFGNSSDTPAPYVTCGFDGQGFGVLVAQAGLAASGSQNCLVVVRRELDGTGTVLLWRATGRANASTWYPMFGPVRFAGRWVFGVQRLEGVGATAPATWYLLECPRVNAALTGLRDLAVVAAGRHNRGSFTLPGTATVVRDSVLGDKADRLRFGVMEGRSFAVNGTSLTVVTAEAVRLEVTCQGAVPAHTGSRLHLSGSVPHVFDGTRVLPAGFMESPMIASVSQAAGASALQATESYSYQVVWRQLDRSGRVTRSMASPIKTVTISTNGNVVSVVPTLPQIVPASEAIEGSANIRVELYAAGPNPTAGANKYLVDSLTIFEGYTSLASRVLTHSAVPAETALPLYTNGDVIDDERPPGGDRGIAVVGNRIWVADDRHVYASKLPRPDASPAWSSEDFLRVDVPSVVGEVEAIAPLDSMLAVLCSAGVLVVRGPGFDDLGQGVGWDAEVVSRVGCMGGPRAAASVPQGVAFQGTDGETYLLARDGSTVSCISRPVRRQNNGSLQVDLAYVPGGHSVGDEPSTNATLVVAGTPVRVLDLEVGQWATWRTGSLDEAEE